MMDDDFIDDLQEVINSIDTVEAMSLFFPMFRKAVVFDTRSNDEWGPMVRIMPMVASPQERLRSIRRLRRGFPRLESLTLIPWARSVDSLVRLGVWDRIVQRFKDSGQEEAAVACHQVVEELRRLEKEERSAAVRGENYRTIWSARE